MKDPIAGAPSARPTMAPDGDSKSKKFLYGGDDDAAVAMLPSPVASVSTPPDEEDQVEQLAAATGMLVDKRKVGTFDAVMANKFVLVCSLFASMAGLEFGVDQGIMSVTLVMPLFLKQFPEIDPANGGTSGLFKGIVTALLELGAVFGAITAGFAADRLGRKGGIRLGLIFFAIGAILQTTSYQYAQLVVGRFVGGIGVGILASVAPLLISEIAPASIRGVLLSMEELCIVFGICVAFYVTLGARYIPNDWSFRLAFLLQLVPGIVMFALSYLLPESPRWLASQRGREDEALRTLARLRQKPAHDVLVQAEFLEIQTCLRVHEEIQAERHPRHVGVPGWRAALTLDMAAYLDCFRADCFKRTLCGILVMFFQQLVGINALIYYSSSLLEQIGLDYELRLQMSGVINLAQLVGVIASLWLIDRVGRRPLLLFGSISMMIAMVIVAILTGKFNGRFGEHQDAGWAGVAMLIIYMVTFGLSWGPIGWALPSELFTSQILRSKGVSLAVVSNFLFNFIVGLVVPLLVEVTPYAAFTFFGIWCFISALWVLLLLPETGGKRLEEMDEIFGDRVGIEDKKRHERIERALLQERSRAAAAAGSTGAMAPSDEATLRNVPLQANGK